ncbi:MAG TPA: TIGR04076 family protein [Candidatus Latescibacteria bacterium]|nr:TIGR04076 family protein [Candidatus Latescibacterota bacterium]
MDLVVRVVEVKGCCPVYKVGDSFRLEEGYKLVSDIPLCMHALAALMPFYNALRVSSPDKWGLAGRDSPEKAYLQCMDPEAYTGGGTVVFEVVTSKSEV